MSRLGVIGGLGAAAGVNLVQRLVKTYQKSGAKSDSDFPDFVYHNLPCYGMDEFGICNQQQVFDQLIGSMHMLLNTKCDVIFIACNTVHVFHERLQMLFPSFTIINNISETCRKVADCKKVGVLCSRNSKSMELFEKALAHINVECIQTDEVEQEVIDDCIAHVITGKQTQADYGVVGNVMVLMRKRGAEKIILGCTELPILVDWEDPDAVDAGMCGMEKAIAILKA